MIATLWKFFECSAKYLKAFTQLAKKVRLLRKLILSLTLSSFKGIIAKKNLTI